MPFSLRKLTKLYIVGALFMIVVASILLATGRYAADSQAPVSLSPQTSINAAADSPVEVFALEGTNLTIHSAGLSNSRGFDEVRLVASHQLGETVQALDVLLFTMTPQGELQSIEGRRLKVEMKSGVRQETSFRPELSPETGTITLLAVKTVVGIFTVKEADTADILRAAIKFKTKGTPQSVTIKNKTDKEAVPDMNFCHTAYVLAQSLQKDQKDFPVVGTTCDQSNQAFQLLFKTKEVSKTK